MKNESKIMAFKKNKLSAVWAIVSFAVILLLQSCGEKTYIDTPNVDDILLKSKIDEILNAYINAKKPTIISYEYTPIQTPIEFFQSSIKSSVCEKVTLQPNVTYEIKYKEDEEIKTCEAMAYYLVKENRSELGYWLVGEGVILTTNIKGINQQALGYGAIPTNLITYGVAISFAFVFLGLFLFNRIISRIEYKNNTIILAISLSIALISLMLGIYWLLRISIAASVVVCSFFLYQYGNSGLLKDESRLEWINGTPVNVSYMTESDMSFGALILSFLFAVIFDILAIVVFFLNNTTIFVIGSIIFQSVCMIISFIIIIIVFNMLGRFIKYVIKKM